MVLNYLNPKQISLYGILNNFAGYTVDHDTLMVRVEEEISFNIGDIEQQILDVESEKEFIQTDENLHEEVKMYRLESLEEVLEVLNVLKNKLNG